MSLYQIDDTDDDSFSIISGSTKSRVSFNWDVEQFKDKVNKALKSKEDKCVDKLYVMLESIEIGDSKVRVFLIQL